MMTTKGIDTGQWSEMFREVGLDDEAMQRWHAVFESRYPEAHQSFLEWLNAPSVKIDQIREASRTSWS